MKELQCLIEIHFEADFAARNRVRLDRRIFLQVTVVALQVKMALSDAKHDLHLFIATVGTLQQKIQATFFEPELRLYKGPLLEIMNVHAKHRAGLSIDDDPLRSRAPGLVECDTPSLAVIELRIGNHAPHVGRDQKKRFMGKPRLAKIHVALPVACSGFVLGFLKRFKPASLAELKNGVLVHAIELLNGGRNREIFLATIEFFGKLDLGFVRKTQSPLLRRSNHGRLQILSSLHIHHVGRKDRKRSQSDTVV